MIWISVTNSPLKYYDEFYTPKHILFSFSWFWTLKKKYNSLTSQDPLILAFCSHHSPHKLWWRMHKTAKKRCWTMFFNRLETDMTFKNNLSRKINGAIREKGALDLEWYSHVALNVFLLLHYIWNIVLSSTGFVLGIGR